jgi:hypothetical protein
MRTGTSARKTVLLLGSSLSHLRSCFWVFVFEERPFSGNCEKFSPLFPIHVDTDGLGRYSNTLLVSLNSRISIRGNENPRVATLSPSIAFDITSNHTSGPTNIALKEMEQPEVVYKASGSMAI